MQFFDIENLKLDYSSLLPRTSGIPKILLLNSYYNKLLSTNNHKLIEAYSSEFIEEYISELNYYSPYYRDPVKTRELIDQLENLRTVQILHKYHTQINDLIISISEKLNKYLSQLENQKKEDNGRGTLYFPLLGKITTSTEELLYSSVEKLTIKISPIKNQDSFIFIPSKQKDEELTEQSKISFSIALDYLKDFKQKFQKYHEVLIYFDNMNAEYEGRSLGIILTIGFIQELTRLYNLPYIIFIRSLIATTGRIDKDGNLISIGDKNVSQKVESVFYSGIDSLIIPKSDETHAVDKLKELNKKFPSRNLKIVPIENITDLLNRRNLIEIVKQPKILRVLKEIEKNATATFFAIMLISILLFIWIRDIDDNPETYEIISNQIIIKNSSGRNLWHINYNTLAAFYKLNLNIESNFRIVDVNNDGENEVLNTFSVDHNFADDDIANGLVLFDMYGKPIWKRSFNKHLLSERETIIPHFNISIYDTLTINNELHILCAVNNADSYPSGIYLLNLTKNSIVSDTLWNSGHVVDARLVDLDNDNLKEILILSYNNSYQKISLTHLLFSELKGQLPATDEYKLLNITDANILNCFLFPNSDLNQYLGLRNTSLRARSLNIDEEFKQIKFGTFETGLYNVEVINYIWHFKNHKFDVIIESNMRVKRDSLVAHGKLKLPYTDTKEYRELMRKQILAWDGEKFVPIDEYKNKRAK